jgi:hypothetical protein
MSRRFVVISSLVALGLALGGCTKCGPIRDDWLQSLKSCNRTVSRADPENQASAFDPRAESDFGQDHAQTTR